MLNHFEVVYRILVLILVLGVGTGLVSGASDDIIQTPEDLVSFVNETVRYMADHGVDKGIDGIMNGGGLYTRQGAVISVYDQNVTLLAHPSFPNEIGKNQINLTDPYGLKIIKHERNIAADGGGFFFMLPIISFDASIGGSHESEYAPHLGYIHPVSDQIWITSDVPLIGMKDPRTGVAYLSGLETYVDDAVEYVRDVGQDKAIRDFDDPNGSFTRGLRSIIAYHVDGAHLELPLFPDLEETDQQEDYVTYGMDRVVRLFRDVHENGSGYNVFDSINNETRQYESKLGYFKMVDDTWLVGSSISCSDLINQFPLSHSDLIFRPGFGNDSR
ncbi:MAG TPA: hypothetical protein VN372_02880 [Methanospirillum sp.]|nr:hypothetical protein [Methanospirillum sp.]